jgi:putative ABC transport system permease protein
MIKEIRPILSALLRSKTGAILVAVQIALSMAILANAIHIVVQRQALMARPSGVAGENDIFYVIMGNQKVEEETIADVTRQKLQAATLRALPGVVSVAQINQMPLSQSGHTNSVRASRTQSNSSGASLYTTADSLIKTFGLKLIDGRDFTPDDVMDQDYNDEGSPDVVIVTRTLADHLWPGSPSAVGKTVYLGTSEKSIKWRVIGVVERLQTAHAQGGPSGEYTTIIPLRRIHWPGGAYAVRAEPGQRDRLMTEAEAAIHRISSAATLVRTESMEQHRLKRYRADMTLSWMLIGVSVLLLLITASGIVGMASLWVTQRRKQIGVRRALGARRADIVRYFVTENIMITSAGVGLGVVMAIGLNSLLMSQLEMSRLPARYLFIGAGALWALGVAAVYGPAWRAATISPALATRSA